MTRVHEARNETRPRTGGSRIDNHPSSVKVVRLARRSSSHRPSRMTRRGVRARFASRYIQTKHARALAARADALAAVYARGTDAPAANLTRRTPRPSSTASARR